MNMNATQVMQSLSNVASIFEAAKTLEYHGLLNGEDSSSVVRRYMEKHPEITEALRRSEKENAK